MAESRLVNNISIIESGSEQKNNILWTYRKWSDGTYECWTILTDSTSAAQHEYSGYFPISFAEKPAMVVSGGNIANVDSGVRYASCSTTGYDVYVIGSWANSSFIQIYAIGRWK